MLELQSVIPEQSVTKKYKIIQFHWPKCNCEFFNDLTELNLLDYLFMELPFLF